MNARIVIITGANSGIGKAAAKRFASEGYHVIMACRNAAAGAIVQNEIIAQTGNKHVHVMELDVSSFDSIRRFSSLYKEQYGKLDVLIHNAAHFKHGEKHYQLSADHVELTFATNVFGPYLLTRLLTGCLRQSDDARILNACSTNIKHFFNPKRLIDFDRLQGEHMETQPYNAYKMYGDSKMALLLLTKKLAEQFKEDGIQVNALQIPATKIAKDKVRQIGSYWRILATVQNVFNPPPEGVAHNYYEICSSDRFKSVTGQLINHQLQLIQPGLPNPNPLTQAKQIFGSRFYPSYASDSASTERVWQLCKQITSN